MSEQKQIEYRVVGKRGRREVVLQDRETWIEAQDGYHLYRNGGTYTNVRVEARTVTTTAWEEVPVA